MAITQAMATSFKVQLLNGQQNFSANTFKLALYTSSASLDENTTAYTSSNEVPSTGNYSAGGNTLTVSVTPTNSGNVAYISFANTSWANATITAHLNSLREVQEVQDQALQALHVKDLRDKINKALVTASDKAAGGLDKIKEADAKLEKLKRK